MKSLFSLDSKFMQGMSRVCDLMILNFFYLLTCVPIFTIGAASAALYTVCFRFGTDRENGVVKPYFRAFRDNFKEATGLWLVIALCGVTAGADVFLFYSMGGAFRWLSVLFGILFTLALLISAYAFPLVSLFRSPMKATLRNALILSLGYLPRTVAVVALNILPFVLLVMKPIAFFQFGFVWIALYFSAAAYGSTFILKKVFAPYLEKKEQEESL